MQSHIQTKVNPTVSDSNTDETSHQTTDRLTEIERSTKRETDRVMGERWMKEKEWAGPQRWGDSKTVICCQGPEALRFLILLATLVMNTGSDSLRHTIKVKVHPLVVSLLYMVRLPSLTLSSSRFFSGCFFALCYKVYFLLSVLIFVFVHRITKQQPTNKAISTSIPLPSLVINDKIYCKSTCTILLIKVRLILLKQ